jgi:hypothetical protein
MELEILNLASDHIAGIRCQKLRAGAGNRSLPFRRRIPRNVVLPWNPVGATAPATSIGVTYSNGTSG